MYRWIILLKKKKVQKHIPQNGGVNWSTALLTPVLAAALFQTVFPRAPTLASVTVPIIQPVRLLTALCPPCVPKRQCAPSLWGSGVTHWPLCAFSPQLHSASNGYTGIPLAGKKGLFVGCVFVFALQVSSPSVCSQAITGAPWGHRRCLTKPWCEQAALVFRSDNQVYPQPHINFESGTSARTHLLSHRNRWRKLSSLLPMRDWAPKITLRGSWNWPLLISDLGAQWASPKERGPEPLPWGHCCVSRQFASRHVFLYHARDFQNVAPYGLSVSVLKYLLFVPSYVTV